MATFVLISSQVLGSSASTVTFSSIPQTYTDLKLIMSARSDRGSSVDTYKITVNGATNYTEAMIVGPALGAVAGSYLATSSFMSSNGGYLEASSQDTGIFNNTEYYFYKYTSTTNKSVGYFNTEESNGTTAYSVVGSHFLTSTAGITTITITINAGSNLVAGSSFYLYGI
jgi:hypothetical protein